MSKQELDVIGQDAACCPGLSAAPLDETQAADLAKVFKALGDPVRLRLMSMIASRGQGGEVCVCELTPAFELSQPTISHHLKLLRQAADRLRAPRHLGLLLGAARRTRRTRRVPDHLHAARQSRRVNSSLGRRAAAEAIGTALLVAVVVGSGIQATELTHDTGVQLLANSLATVFGLGVLILLLGPVSGAHFNPVVTLAAWLTGRRDPYGGLALRDVVAYVPAQATGAIGGAVLADAMFAEPLVKFSTHDRSAGHLLLGEVVATAGLILLIFGLVRIGRATLAPAAVAAYIGAAYWFTSSTSFVNPAVTIGRASPTPSPASLPPRSPRSSRHRCWEPWSAWEPSP